jgi:hypothetical protein
MMLDDVHAALRTQLNVMVGTAPIAWEGVKYDPPNGPFLQPYLLPAETFTPTMGDTFERLEGVFQVNVNTPAGSGSGVAENLAEQVLALFRRGEALTSGGVTVVIQKSWRGAGTSDGVWYRIPVSIRFWANIDEALLGN